MIETLDVEAPSPPKDTDQCLHLYEEMPVKPGDKALCGHVKRPGSIADRDRCVVCADLNRKRVEAKRRKGWWIRWSGE